MKSEKFKLKNDSLPFALCTLHFTLKN